MKVRTSLPPKRPSSTRATPKIKAEEHTPTRVTPEPEDDRFVHLLLPPRPNTQFIPRSSESWQSVREWRNSLRLHLFLQTFITVFTTAHNWSVSWSIWIHPTPSLPVSLSTLMLSFHRCLGLPGRQFCPFFHITSLCGCLFCVTLERVAALRLYVQYIASAGRVRIRRSFRMVRRRNAALVSKFSLEAVSSFGFFCTTDKIHVTLCLCSVVSNCWHPPYWPICANKLHIITTTHFQCSQQLLVSAL